MLPGAGGGMAGAAKGGAGFGVIGGALAIGGAALLASVGLLMPAAGGLAVAAVFGSGMGTEPDKNMCRGLEILLEAAGHPSWNL